MSATRLLILAAAAAVVAGIVALVVAYRADLAEAREGLAGRADVVETALGGVEVAVAGEGRPVLVVHGSGGGFDQGLALGAPIADRGWRILAPSRFGYLGTPMPDGASPALQADAFAALLDALGIGALPVVGVSAGALSAVEFAIRHPERCEALVLMVPASFAPERAPDESGIRTGLGRTAFEAVLRSDLLFWLGIRFAPDFMLRGPLATEPALVAAAPPEERRRIGEVLRAILPVSARAEGIAFDSATAGRPEPLPLGEVGCPVLAISAEDDLYGTAAAARHAAAGVSEGKAVVFPSGGHLLVGRTEEVAELIDAFLRGSGR